MSAPTFSANQCWTSGQTIDLLKIVVVGSTHALILRNKQTCQSLVKNLKCLPLHFTYINGAGRSLSVSKGCANDRFFFGGSMHVVPSRTSGTGFVCSLSSLRLSFRFVIPIKSGIIGDLFLKNYRINSVIFRSKPMIKSTSVVVN